jgi:hypothetical protein
MESEHLFLHGHCYFVTRMLYVQHGMRNSFSLVLNRVKMKFVIVGIRLRTRRIGMWKIFFDKLCYDCFCSRVEKLREVVFCSRLVL